MTWTFQSAGDVSTSTTVGQPATKNAGDLLIAATFSRSSSATLSGIDTGLWTEKHSVTGRAAKIFMRYASNDSNDAFAPSWSGGEAQSQILCLTGHTVDLGSIIIGSPADSAVGNSNIPTSALTVSEDHAAVVAFGFKQKTATSDGVTLSLGTTGINNATGFNATTGDFSTVFASGYTIQTTASNLSASQWTLSISDSQETTSVLVALSIGSTAAVTPLIRTSGVLGKQLIR